MGKENTQSTPKLIPTPLPFWQICESLNINTLFPFLAFMVEDFGYGGDHLGYYAGFLVASFFAAQFCSSIFWGILSDRYGRKGILIFGILGTAVGMATFGFATTYTQAILGRMLSGFLSGNLGVMKSFLTEITDDSNRGTGFSILSVAWAMGTTVAPLAGGLLCKPAQKYPNLFRAGSMFDHFPYALPCLLCVFFNIISAVLIMVCMQDSKTVDGNATNRPKYDPLSMESEHGGCNSSFEVNLGQQSAGGYLGVQVVDDDGDDEEVQVVLNEVGSVDNDADGPSCCSRCTRSVFGACCCTSCCIISQGSDVVKAEGGDEKVLLKPVVLLTTSIYGLLCMAYILYDETLPLFLKQDVQHGGFDLSSSEIGVMLSVSGFAMLLFTTLFLPSISRGSKLRMLLTSSTLAIPLALMWPVLGLLRPVLFGDLSDRTRPVAVLSSLVLVSIVKLFMSCISYTASMIIINHSVPNRHLGQVNGLGQTFGSLARAVGPAVGGVIWSLSVRYHFLFLNFIAVAVLLVLVIATSSAVPRSLDHKLEEGSETARDYGDGFSEGMDGSTSKGSRSLTSGSSDDSDDDGYPLYYGEAPVRSRLDLTTSHISNGVIEKVPTQRPAVIDSHTVYTAGSKALVSGDDNENVAGDWMRPSAKDMSRLLSLQIDRQANEV